MSEATTRADSGSASSDVWTGIRQQLRARGMRWTPQRRLLLSVLERADGHVTAAELVERCRAADPQVTPSTVYRTLDVLEELGVVRHGHGADGREEFHVLPSEEHGHLYCRNCGRSWELDASEAASMIQSFETERGFQLDLSHLSIVGLCAACREG